MVDRYEEQWARIKAVVGDSDDLSLRQGVERYYGHLKASLRLPCDVTGTEDLNWEELYILGLRSQKEYAQLRKTQPSYRDTFVLLAIEKDVASKWMLFAGDDLAARVRCKSDAKEFLLGLSEIEAVDKKSLNCQLLDDFSVWFANSR